MAWLICCGNNHQWRATQLPPEGPSALRCPTCGAGAIGPPLPEEANAQSNPIDATLVGSVAVLSASSVAKPASDVAVDGTMALSTPPPASTPPADGTLMLSGAVPKQSAAPDDTLNVSPSSLPSTPMSQVSVDDTLMGATPPLSAPALRPADMSVPDPSGEITERKVPSSAVRTERGPRLPTGRGFPGSLPSVGAGGVAPVEGYEIISVLGRGGMGIVFKAKQTKLDRVVALKMILSGAYSSEQDLDRFQAEAQAVAQFQHPNILQIYEVGERNGQPYFSLEFMEGGTLQNKLEKSPMSAEDSARMIEVLARALAYAHQKGILHRDIKPANVLLAADGTPKIADFGLAKRLDREESLNASDSVVGTPTYMPPEQALGKKDIGPTADIYALGATLYEMLCGRPPFRGATVLDTLKQVQELDPVPLRVLQPTVPGDLQTICLKCLQKDPKQRYQTAEALAGDLRNYLEGRPIEARPVSGWEKAWKWSRRNPALASLIGVTSASLLAFAIGGTLFAVTERQRANTETGLRKAAEELQQQVAKERDHAIEQEKLAKKRGKEAIDNFKEAQRAVKVMVDLARNRLAHERHVGSVGRELMEEALAFYDSFLTKKPDDAVMREEIAKAYASAGDLREKLGRYEEADKAYSAAIKLFEQLIVEDPGDHDHKRDLANAHLQRSTVLQVLRRDDEADEAFSKAKDLLKNLPPDDRTELERDWNMAVGFRNRAIAYQNKGNPAAAEELYLKAEDLFEQLLKDNPQRHRIASELAKTRIDVAGVWSDDFTKANAMFQKAFDQLVPLAEAHPKAQAFQTELGAAYINRSKFHNTHEKLAAAAQDSSAAVKIFHGLADEYPDVVDYRVYLANAHRNHGVARQKQKDWHVAAEAFRASTDIWSRLVKSDEKLTFYRKELADVLRELALSLDSRFRAELAQKEPKVSDVILDAHAKEAEDAWDDAFAQFKKLRELGAVDLSQITKWVEADNRLMTFHMLQATRSWKTQPERAERHLQRRVAWQREKLSSAPKDPGLKILVADALLPLAMLYIDAQKPAEASRTIQEVTTLATPSWNRYPGAAGLLAKCIPVAEKTLKDKERDQAVKDYGERALAMLTDAVNAGFDNVAFLQKEPMLQPLRERPEFRAVLDKLIASIEKK